MIVIKDLHIGSQSVDANDNSEAAINAIVKAVVVAIPNLTHITFSTFLDYGYGSANDQFLKWSNAIHSYNKKMIVRSAGFNDWQGSNGVPQYTQSDFCARHKTQLTTWIEANYGIFQSGDMIEGCPDEPENNTQWNAYYTSLSTVDGKAAFNTFITDCITILNNSFATHNVTGVTTNFMSSNPSVIKDVITEATANALLFLGTDNYPENGDTTPAEMEASMETEVSTWINPAQAGHNKHITMGPSVFTQLSEADQADALKRELRVLRNNVNNFYGLGVWQMGNGNNDPLSRLFDYTGGNWVARPAAYTLNRFFGSGPFPVHYREP